MWTEKGLALSCDPVDLLIYCYTKVDLNLAKREWAETSAKSYIFQYIIANVFVFLINVTKWIETNTPHCLVPM